MRISENTRYGTIQNNLSRLAEQHAEASQAASSGRQVSALSDDPVAAARLVRLKGEIGHNGRLQTNISHARSDAEIAEGALAEANTLFQRARELSVLGANGSTSTQGRIAIATEVSNLRDQLVALSNARGNLGYIFAGSQVDQAAFDAAGVFQGDGAEHNIEISPGLTTRVSVSGEQAFTVAGGIDVFAVLNDLEANLLTDDEATIATSLTDIDAALEQLSDARTDAGLILTRLDTANSALQETEHNLWRQDSELGDADLFKAFSDLTVLTNTIEQAIAVSRTTLETQRF